MSENVLTLPEAARALEISLDDVLRLIELGLLSAGRLGARTAAHRSR